MKKIIIYLIRSYQKNISPNLGNNCRFDPTCSEYTIQAVEEWGVFLGLCLGFSRILRCNPFNKKWGVDDVPKRKKK